MAYYNNMTLKDAHKIKESGYGNNGREKYEVL